MGKSQRIYSRRIVIIPLLLFSLLMNTYSKELSIHLHNDDKKNILTECSISYSFNPFLRHYYAIGSIDIPNSDNYYIFLDNPSCYPRIINPQKSLEVLMYSYDPRKWGNECVVDIVNSTGEKILFIIVDNANSKLIDNGRSFRFDYYFATGSIYIAIFFNNFQPIVRTIDIINGRGKVHIRKNDLDPFVETTPLAFNSTDQSSLLTAADPNEPGVEPIIKPETISEVVDSTGTGDAVLLAAADPNEPGVEPRTWPETVSEVVDSTGTGDAALLAAADPNEPGVELRTEPETISSSYEIIQVILDVGVGTNIYIKNIKLNRLSDSMGFVKVELVSPRKYNILIERKGHFVRNYQLNLD
ncbi:MAG: hypothetical protein JW866_09960 [Ignavibacteriales bacterium]|nr:hypothetical protein [Ignavibacteriales bacterium]